MNLLALCDINDNSKLARYTDLNSFFNPTVNKYFSPSQGSLDNAQWIAWLKALCTKDNILNNFSMFFSESYPASTNEATTGIIRHLINETPEEHLIAFSCIQFLTSGSTIQIYSLLSGLHPSATNAPALLTDWLALAKTISEALPLRHSLNGHIQFSGATLTYAYWFLRGSLQYSMTMSAQTRGVRTTTVRVQEAQNILALSDEARFTVRNDYDNYTSISFLISTRVTNTNRKPICQTLDYGVDVLQILDHDLDKRMKTPVNKPLLGVELELTTKYTTEQLIMAQEELFAIFKQDSTISGAFDNKVEMVTLPLHYDELKQHFGKWFSALPEDGFDQTKRTTNGMHVHIDRRVFGSKRDGRKNYHELLHLRKFTWFYTFPGNVPFIQLVSERQKAHFESYSNVPDYSGFSSKSKAFLNCVSQANAIRGAVNLRSNKPTVEVRIFKGIVSFATILKNLEFIEATIEFTKDASLQRLTVSDFLSWLKKTPKTQYNNLKVFLELSKSDVMECSEVSEISNHVFTENNPDRIVEILKDKAIEITASHTRFLNKMVGAKTFIMENGGLSVTRSNYGKISHLDKQLVERFSKARAA